MKSNNRGVPSRKSGTPPPDGREVCLCGHRASEHTVMKYSCRAAGKHKGYCPCMYFLAAKAAQGNRIRAPWRLAKEKQK